MARLGWREWALVALVAFVLAGGLASVAGALAPLEEPCDDPCVDRVFTFGCDSAARYTNRVCPLCGKAWVSNDVFGWGWMVGRLRRAIMPAP